MGETIFGEKAVKLLAQAEKEIKSEMRCSDSPRNASIALERVQEAVMWLEEEKNEITE